MNRPPVLIIVFLILLWPFAAQSTQDTSLVDTLIKLAEDNIKANRYDSAELKIKEAFVIARKINYDRGKAICFKWLGHCAMAHGQLDTANHHYLRSLEIWQSLPDSLEMGKACHNLATVFDYKGDPVQQEKFAKRAYHIFRQLKLGELMGVAAMNLGNFFKTKDHRQAVAYFEEAIQLLENSQQSNYLAAAKYNLGELHYRNDKPALSRALLFEAVPLLEEAEDTARLAQAYNLLGAICYTKKNYAGAENHFTQSLDLAKRSQQKPFQFDACLNLADVAIKKSQVKKAQDYLNEAKSLEMASLSREDQYALDKIKYSLESLKLLIRSRNLTFYIILLVITLVFALYSIYLFDQQKKLRQKNHDFILRKNRLRYEGEVLKLFEKIKQTAAETRMKTEREERSKLKKLVHNNIGSHLAATCWNIESCQTAFKENRLEAKDLETIWEMTNKAYRNSRDIEKLLEKNHSRWLEEISSFFDLLAKNKNGKPRIKFLNHGLSNCIPAEMGKVIYEIIKIATANALLYAKAENFTCQINRTDEELLIIIEDDGIGFNVHKKVDGNGIKNLKEMVKKLDGQVQIDSSPGKGTTISITIPIND